MTTLSKDDLRVLELARQRLYQLTDSLNSLNRDIHTAHPLPSWPSLQSRLSLLATHLSSLQTHLSTHSALFASVAVFPLPQFPGREQEAMLAQMLRKKLEMGVEEWVQRGWEGGRKLVAESDREGVVGGGRRMRKEDWTGQGDDEEDGDGDGDGDGGGEKMGLWKWAMLRSNGDARAMVEAREEEEEEEEGGEEEGESGGMKVEEGGEDSGEGTGGQEGKGEGAEPLEMGQVLRFMSTGVEPVRSR
ncbi:MAG: hypothetical protein Q9184_004453 [Pyrenodesmia sp. 2 TL-2023]